MTTDYQGWTIQTRHTLDGYVADVTAPDARTYTSEIPRPTKEEAEEDARVLIRNAATGESGIA